MTSTTASARTIRAELLEHTDAGGRVRRLTLRTLTPPPRFEAGQYLLIETDDDAAGTGGVPFSIASAPRELPTIELHFQPETGSDDARRVESAIARAERGEPMTLTLPLGGCGVSAPPAAPLVIVSAGTGVTQARSILREHLAASGQPIHLYWGVREADERYLHAELEALARVGALRYRSAVEARAPRGAFPGNVLDAIAADLAHGEPDLGASDVLLCGGPPMVHAAVERLRPLGLVRERTRSDVFDYAPREDIWR